MSNYLHGGLFTESILKRYLIAVSKLYSGQLSAFVLICFQSFKHLSMFGGLLKAYITLGGSACIQVQKLKARFACLLCHWDLTNLYDPANQMDFEEEASDPEKQGQ